MSHTVCTIGTSHFVSHQAARSYYRTQGDDADAVNTRIKDGDIVIGPPRLKEGQRMKLSPAGQYMITELVESTPPEEGAAHG